VSIVKAVRRDQRLADVMIGAPAGQPEFAEWATLLGDDGAAVPFLRYLPERLTPLGARVETDLRQRLGQAPSFVAFEGYDTITVLADMLPSNGWSRVAVDGTRGQIRHQRLAVDVATGPGCRAGPRVTRSAPDPAPQLSC